MLGCQRFLRGGINESTAFVKQHNPITVGGEQVDVVGCHQHTMTFVSEASQQFHQLQCVFKVKIVRWFVEEQ